MSETLNERRFWLELREPKRVPERKGPWPCGRMKGVLREFMEARPTAYLTVITWSDHFGPLLTDGPEQLMILDGRSRSTALRHIRSTRAAHQSDVQTYIKEAGE